MTVYAPGMDIGNPSATTGGEDGALGCFARKRDDQSPVLLSCAHVLFANLPDAQNLAIACPPPSSTCCSGTQIATTLKTWVQGFGTQLSVKITGVTQVQSGFQTDCAMAKLLDTVSFTNEIPVIGMISGAPSGNLGIVAGPPFGTPPTADQYVRFYSPLTKRVHYGTILTLPDQGTIIGGGALDPLLEPWTVDTSLDAMAEAQPNIAQILVMPRPAPGEGLPGSSRLYFGRGGDSGSVVVNKDNQVIGIICRGGGKPDISNNSPEWNAVGGIGVLNPIQKVLDVLGVDIPASFSRTVASAGGSAIYMAGIDPEEKALQLGRRRIEEKLEKTRLGRLLIGKLSEHRVEARRIVLGNRRALVVWRRHQGPAMIQHFIKNLRDPAHVVPTQINGVNRAALMRAMAGAFLRYGSPRLRRDVEKYREIALRYGPGITSVDQVPLLVEQLRHERASRWLRARKESA